MANPIPQHILDAMTDVHLPREVTAPKIDEIVEFDGLRIPVYRAPAVVLG
ncbi:hypothetical protein SAMN05660652_03150, partial [Propionivibrio dicarboxylicus]